MTEEITLINFLENLKKDQPKTYFLLMCFAAADQNQIPLSLLHDQKLFDSTDAFNKALQFLLHSSYMDVLGEVSIFCDFRLDPLMTDGKENFELKRSSASTTLNILDTKNQSTSSNKILKRSPGEATLNLLDTMNQSTSSDDELMFEMEMPTNARKPGMRYLLPEIEYLEGRPILRWGENTNILEMDSALREAISSTIAVDQQEPSGTLLSAPRYQ